MEWCEDDRRSGLWLAQDADPSYKLSLHLCKLLGWPRHNCIYTEGAVLAWAGSCFGGVCPLAINESTALKYQQLDPDVRLMIRVRDDDALAFEQLMLAYQSRLITVLEHLVGNLDRAEDLSQDVFLRVYRARKNYLPRAKFSTWLFTIAHNVARNSQRSKARRPEIQMAARNSGPMPHQAIEQLAQAASGLMPTRQLDKAERVEVVRWAVGALNERQRMAVLLSRFEGMSYAEISEVMHLSPQAIKSLLSRARGRLRDLLAPYFDEGCNPAAIGE